MAEVDVNKDFIFAVGRRRTSVARVRLYKKVKEGLTFGNIEIKKGDVIVNGKNIKEYFSNASFISHYEGPLSATDNLNKFTITAKIAGGGIKGQLGAYVLGLSRALVALDHSNKALLSGQGLMERDSRTRERRKVGTGGKARRQKQSPKR